MLIHKGEEYADFVALVNSLEQKLEKESSEGNYLRMKVEALELHLRDANLQNSALREALAFCVDEYGCSYSAQGEYDNCATTSTFGARLCAICRARRLLHSEGTLNRSGAERLTEALGLPPSAVVPVGEALEANAEYLKKRSCDCLEPGDDPNCPHNREHATSMPDSKSVASFEKRHDEIQMVPCRSCQSPKHPHLDCACGRG